MAADSENVEVIKPNIDSLKEVETNLTCPMQGCAKILSNSSALRMHLVKTHKANSFDDVFERSCENKAKRKCFYCCPVDTCVRGENTGRYFHRLAHVKQHYMNVHGEKKFTCGKCPKKFGRNDACLRHEKMCGVIFTCSCRAEFNSRTSLLTHARRNNHLVPGANEIKTGSTPVISVEPKKTFSEAATQTVMPCYSVNKNILLLQSDKCCSVNESLLMQEDKGIMGDISLRRNSKETCESSLLGRKEPEKLLEKCDRASSSCLLEDKFAGIDVKSTRSADANVSLLTEKEGVENTERSDIDACTQTAKCLQVDFDEHFEFDKDFSHSQTQTHWDLTFPNFPLFEDNQTQTLDSYFDSTIDCATQTILDEIFSVDTQTQTFFPSINFDEDLAGLGTSMDGQTQTLPWSDFPETASLDTLQGSTSNVETQTAFNMQK